MKFPSPDGYTCFAFSPTQIVELHRVKLTPSAFNAYPPIPRHATMMAAGVMVWLWGKSQN